MKQLKIVLLTLLVIAVISCDKEKEDLILLNETVIILNFGDEYQIEAMSISEITYSSENEYHAIVSEDGLVSARFVGETNIVLSNNEDAKTIKIVVEPVYNLYPDPDFDFGTSRASLIAKYGTPDIENESGIGYINYSSKAPKLAYNFDDNDNLKIAGVLVKTAYSSSLASFLVERYKVLDVDNSLFINGLTIDDASMTIGMELFDLSYWSVIYTQIEK